MKKNKPLTARRKARSVPQDGSAITPKDLEKALVTLKELAAKIEYSADEIPAFSFVTDGKKAKIFLISSTLDASREIDFWEEVDAIGSDNGGSYHPRSMEFWIKAFRDAADRLEHDLKDMRSKPSEWRPLEDYN